MKTLYKSKYVAMIHKQITVYCTDGDTVSGEWIDWTSEQDNEPDGESVTLRIEGIRLCEIPVSEIERIEEITQ
jgi:hypothetical protein